MDPAPFLVPKLPGNGFGGSAPELKMTLEFQRGRARGLADGKNPTAAAIAPLRLGQSRSVFRSPSAALRCFVATAGTAEEGCFPRSQHHLNRYAHRTQGGFSNRTILLSQRRGPIRRRQLIEVLEIVSRGFVQRKGRHFVCGGGDSDGLGSAGFSAGFCRPAFETASRPEDPRPKRNWPLPACPRSP